MSAAHPIDGGLRLAPVAHRGRRERPGPPALLILGGAAGLAALAMAALVWLWPHFPPLDWEASAPLWIAAACGVAALAVGAWVMSAGRRIR